MSQTEAAAKLQNARLKQIQRDLKKREAQRRKAETARRKDMAKARKAHDAKTRATNKRIYRRIMRKLI